MKNGIIKGISNKVVYGVSLCFLVCSITFAADIYDKEATQSSLQVGNGSKWQELPEIPSSWYDWFFVS